MSIDLDSTEGRKQYLSEKLDDLLVGINDSYGTLLMEELLARLELTIKDFNDEIKNLCDELIKKEKERQQLLEMLKSTDGMQESAPAPTQTTASDVEPEDLTPLETEEPEADVDGGVHEMVLECLERLCHRHLIGIVRSLWIVEWIRATNQANARNGKGRSAAIPAVLAIHEKDWPAVAARSKAWVPVSAPIP